MSSDDSPYVLLLIQVMKSTTSTGFATLVFNMAPQGGVTYDTVIAILTSSRNTLQFPLPDGSTVPLYLATDNTAVPQSVQVTVLQLGVLNADLAKAIPLSPTDEANQATTIRELIDAKTSLGSDILNVSFVVSFTTN